MPSGLTHIMLVTRLPEKLEKDSNLQNILLSGQDFLKVGAIAPDLPYASVIDDINFKCSKIELPLEITQSKTGKLSKKNSYPYESVVKTISRNYYL